MVIDGKGCERCKVEFVKRSRRLYDYLSIMPGVCIVVLTSIN